MDSFGGGDWHLLSARLIWKTERWRWEVNERNLEFYFFIFIITIKKNRENLIRQPKRHHECQNSVIPCC